MVTNNTHSVSFTITCRDLLEPFSEQLKWKGKMENRFRHRSLDQTPFCVRISLSSRELGTELSSHAIKPSWRTRRWFCETLDRIDIIFYHAMGYGLKLLALFLSVSFLYAVGILLFTRGFLLKRLVIDEYSDCSENVTYYLSDRQQSSNIEGCWLKKRHAKAVIIIIDALRYDFALFNASVSEQEALPYRNKLSVIRDVLENTPENGALFRFVADPPTTTMQRLKGLTTGKINAFLINLWWYFLPITETVMPVILSFTFV